MAVGGQIKVDALAEVKSVDITGTTKGRGFAGAIKRHKFSGQRATHGVKKCHRALGGTGASAFPSRVVKGKRMPGQLGNVTQTVRNQKLVKVDAENNLLLVLRRSPGPKRRLRRHPRNEHGEVTKTNFGISGVDRADS